MPRVMVAATGEVQAVIGARFRQLLASPAHELVDIAMIVGQQDPGLHLAPVGARVVLEPLQRVVDADGVEEGQRQGLARPMVPLAVGDLVAHLREARHRKVNGQFGGRDAVAPEVVALFEHVRVGDFLFGPRDFDAGAIVADQVAQLLDPDSVGNGRAG